MICGHLSPSDESSFTIIRTRLFLQLENWWDSKQLDFFDQTARRISLHRRWYKRTEPLSNLICSIPTRLYTKSNQSLIQRKQSWSKRRLIRQGDAIGRRKFVKGSYIIFFFFSLEHQSSAPWRILLLRLRPRLIISPFSQTTLSSPPSRLSPSLSSSNSSPLGTLCLLKKKKVPCVSIHRRIILLIFFTIIDTTPLPSETAEQNRNLNILIYECSPYHSTLYVKRT